MYVHTLPSLVAEGIVVAYIYNDFSLSCDLARPRDYKVM